MLESFGVCSLEEAVAGKVLYLLIFVILVQFGYPITELGPVALVIYEILYASMLTVGVVVSRDSWWHVVLLTITGLGFLIPGVIFAFNPSKLLLIGTFGMLFLYLLLLLLTMGRFLARVRVITRDVIYAAITLYLLIGAVFVPLYGLLETLFPASFRDGSFPDAPVSWQQFIYFSYTTLTSSGYGDILPVSWWARSLANFEMIVGVLFLGIVMSRLVALYNAER